MVGTASLQRGECDVALIEGRKFVMRAYLVRTADTDTKPLLLLPSPQAAASSLSMRRRAAVCLWRTGGAWWWCVQLSLGDGRAFIYKDQFYYTALKPVERSGECKDTTAAHAVHLPHMLFTCRICCSLAAHGVHLPHMLFNCRTCCCLVLFTCRDAVVCCTVRSHYSLSARQLHSH